MQDSRYLKILQRLSGFDFAAGLPLQAWNELVLNCVNTYLY